LAKEVGRSSGVHHSDSRLPRKGYPGQRIVEARVGGKSFFFKDTADFVNALEDGSVDAKAEVLRRIWDRKARVWHAVPFVKTDGTPIAARDIPLELGDH